MATNAPHQPSAFNSLSARLLVLTIFFVMVAEFLIYAPSISRFRKVYLEQHIASAHLAILALAATPDGMVSEKLEKQLLTHAGAYGIVMHRPDLKQLMLSTDMPPKVDVAFDLRPMGEGDFITWMGDAFRALAQKENRIMRVIGYSAHDPSVGIEVVLDEAPMRQAMVDFSARILQLSIVISLFTAGLVYLSLQWLTVRPLRRITRSMMAFHENPEDESVVIATSNRKDEVGVAQRELAVMQNELRAALLQKTRLATLGAAVAKINHDLRNCLATAVLVSDRLADIDDPEVQKVTPRLYKAIDRAINLCSQTLNYVADQVPSLRFSRFSLSDLVTEVASSLVILGPSQGPGEDGLKVINDVARGQEITADREQLFRVLSNLGFNAHEAGGRALTITAQHQNGRLLIDVADDGPGLAAKAEEHLFQPFAGSARDTGTGLGLIIVRDILRAHGGDIHLLKSDPGGVTFRLDLPPERRSRPR